MAHPMILIHGYSDKGESFQKWKDILIERGIYKKEDVHICSYKSLTNEVTIKDIAEGFDRFDGGGRLTMALFEAGENGLANVVSNLTFDAGAIKDWVTRMRARGVTILMVEQNASRCLQICDRAYVLDQGRNAYTGTGQELSKDPKVIELYLGTLAKA